MGKITFNNSNSLFFQSLKSSVEAYFKTNGIKKTGDWRLYSKALILLPLAVIIYVSLLALNLSPGISILLCAFAGVGNGEHWFQCNA
jgi:linoleoyl-CoA desaturase